MRKVWYAAMLDENDLDFSKGTYNRDDAEDLCEQMQAKYLAAVYYYEDKHYYHIQLVRPCYNCVR